MARRRGEFTTGKQRILLEDKLAELEERRRKLERMSASRTPNPLGPVRPRGLRLRGFLVVDASITRARLGKAA